MDMSTQPVQPQKKSKAPWLIGCGVLLLVSIPICGILAAIAIPAFLRSVKQSKASEAQSMTRRLATGAQAYWEENCAFPPALPRTADLATFCGGGKNVPTVQDAGAAEALGVTFNTPMYFAYSTEVEEFGESANYVIRAEADFQCEGPVHTLELRVSGVKDGETCTAEVQPSFVIHEFE